MPKKTAARVVAIAAGVMLLALLAWWMTAEPDHITVVSWGGDYEHAQADALFHPYTDESGVEVRPALYGGGVAEVGRQAQAAVPDWDVVDFELPDAAEACRRGFLESIDPASLPQSADGKPAADDFVPGAWGRAGSAAWSIPR